MDKAHPTSSRRSTQSNKSAPTGVIMGSAEIAITTDEMEAEMDVVMYAETTDEMTNEKDAETRDRDARTPVSGEVATHH